ncbi:MAG: electron transfer flavoprotein subunit alpha/FixB family protein [Dehalococcoidia bacterium]|nr:electron transfer flavoprotein subunit alpha/FixB family protein [Dehalococcoidia bacterium]
MSQIFVLAEHRSGTIRDITWEMLTKGRELASKSGAQLTAILLGHQVKSLAGDLAQRADRVLMVEDQRLANFNSELYQNVLSALIDSRKPMLTMIGHTGFGLDLAPSLAAEKGLSLSTDCIDLQFSGDRFVALRQMYGGKVNVQTSFSQPQACMATIRPGSCPATESGLKGGEVEIVESPLKEDAKYKKFIEYVEAAKGDVDLTQADIIVSVGYGIKDPANIPMVEELAKAMGGTLACSRPVVDKKWLPKYRQVGTSGTTVAPKLYVAIGISGAFQHLAGIRGAGTLIAINKDPRAPIFGVADYGIVDDLFKVVPLLKDRMLALKGG